MYGGPAGNASSSSAIAVSLACNWPYQRACEAVSAPQHSWLNTLTSQSHIGCATTRLQAAAPIAQLEVEGMHAEHRIIELQRQPATGMTGEGARFQREPPIDAARHERHRHPGDVVDDEPVLRSFEHVWLAQRRPQRLADRGGVGDRGPLFDLRGHERPQAALGLGLERDQFTHLQDVRLSAIDEIAADAARVVDHPLLVLGPAPLPLARVTLEATLGLFA